MKRILSIIVITLITISFSFGQSDSIMRNKNGFPILPAKGDVAVGMSMSPFFHYFGNFFHGNNTTGPLNAQFLTNSFQPGALFFKYFYTNNMAFRASFEFSSNTTTNSFYVQDDAAVLIDPLSNAKVTDIQYDKNRSYVFGLGIEKRRGSTRLQGVYGADVLISYQNNKQEYKYGNPMSAANPLPTTHNFGTNIYNGGRVLHDHNGEQYGIGANVFVGVEYFVLPKISIGAEVAYGFMLTKTGQAKFDYEYWNVDHQEMIVAENPGDVVRAVGTANPSANFFLMFHF